MDRVPFNPKRTALICAVSVALVFVFMYNLIIGSGLVPGADEAVDARTQKLENIAARRATIEGSFVDRNGLPITVALEPGVPAEVQFDESYSYLIGYNTAMYGTSGLRRTMYDYIFYGNEDGVGATVKLTTDNDLQEYCYGLLEGSEGSIVVLNAGTGAILACASRSSAEIGYNVNEIDSRFRLYSQHEAFFLNRAIMAEGSSGSTFKIITAASMVENGMEDYTYFDDTGAYTVGGTKIYNYKKQVFGKTLDLGSAMKYSANVYFASAGVKLNARNLQDTAHRFLFGQTQKLDFCTLSSTFDLGNLSDRGLLAQTAFGQGKVNVSPLQIACVMAAVVNDGVMMKPYLIESVADEGEILEQITLGDTVFTMEPEVASFAMEPEVAERLQYYLNGNAAYYGFDDAVYGKVYAKTGTADQANGRNHIFYLVGVETEMGSYAILVDRRNTSQTSGALKRIAMDVLAYLVTM
jgi:peptidoglycan glycosyltransferase